MGTVIHKQLREILQEKQEPFMLDIYLLEKGCSRKDYNPDNYVRCCSANSKGFLKRSLRLGVNKKSRKFSNCSKVVKAVFGKIVLVSNKVKKDNGSSEQDLSSSLPESDIENSPNSSRKKEIETKKNQQQRYKEDNKELRLSPDSVLDKKLSCDNSSPHGNGKQFSKSRDSGLAVPVCKFTIKLPPNEPNCTEIPSKYLSSKKVLYESKQLLFDCVRELLETNKWKLRKENNLLRALGADEINKLLCEDIRVWSKLSGNESNVTQLLKVDFGASIGEWSDFETQTRQISAEIGDAIFEDICKEIVEEMVAKP